MIKVVNKFLLAGNKFMPEMHLRQPGFKLWTIYWKQRIKKFKETRDSRCIYQNELDKASFQHDMVYGNFKDLPRRTTSDKVVHDKAFNIDENLKYDGYQIGLASVIYNCFDKRFLVVVLKLRLRQTNVL